MVSTVCSPYVHIPYNNSQIPTCSILDRQSFDKIHGQHPYGGGVCYMDIFAKQQWHCPPGSSQVNLSYVHHSIYTASCPFQPPSTHPQPQPHTPLSATSSST